MSAPIALIFGAGANVGLSVAKKFNAEGYKVAGVARNPKDDLKQLAVKAIAADLTNPDEVGRVFQEVEAALGLPSVVVYNAYGLTPADGSDPLTVPLDAFANNLAVNTTSAYAAASAAVQTFTKLAEAKSPHNRVFIYTGNMCSSLIIREGLTLGIGKVATAYAIETAASVYGKEGNGEKGLWYFADERFENGEAMMGRLEGESHAEHYWHLANQRNQEPWNQTFVKGKGYVSFKDTVPDKRVADMGELVQEATAAAEKRK